MFTNSPEPCSIRRGNSSDLPSVVDIWIEGVVSGFCIPPPPPEDALQFFAEKLSRQTERFGIWVAMRAGSIVGWMALQPCRSNPFDALTVAEISTYVSSLDRRKGVGRALLRFTHEHAKRVQIRELRANIAATNEASLNLFESHGWSRVGLLPRAANREPEYFFYAYAVSLAKISQNEMSPYLEE